MLSVAEYTLHGLIWAIVADAQGATRELAPGAPLAVPDEGWLWLHFNLADSRTCGILESQLELPERVSALLYDADEFQQLHSESPFISGMISDISRDIDGPTEQFGYLHFAIGERLIVTARRHSLTAVAATRGALLKHDLKVATTVDLIGIIFEEVVEAVDAFADRLADDIDGIEDKVILGLTHDQRRALGRLRRTAVRLHRHITGLRLMIQRLERLSMRSPTSLPLLDAVRPLSQRIEQLDRAVVGLRERARLLQEEVAAILAEESNRHLRVLSILSIVFLPPTFIAGLLGMNLKGMVFAESELGFWAGTGLAAGSAIVVLWIINRMGIFGSRDSD